MIAGEILMEKRASLGTGWKDAVVAVKASPFCEMVGDIEGGWRGSGIFVVDEGDCGRFTG